MTTSATTDQLFSHEQNDVFRQISHFGSGILGDVDHMGQDFTMPYKFAPQYLKKESLVLQLPTNNVGRIGFQCMKQPQYLLSNYIGKEGLFTYDEVFNDLTTATGYDDNCGNFAKVYKEDTYYKNFADPEVIVKYIRPFGVTTTEDLSENEKRTKSYQTKYCVFGKVAHSVYFPEKYCKGAIKCSQFIPVPNYQVFGDIYVFLGFDEEKKLKYYFSDNPAFTNLSDTHPDLPFSMVLKIGWFRNTDINFRLTYIDTYCFYESRGFVFDPDFNWKFYANQSYNNSKGIYIGKSIPTYMYDELLDFIPDTDDNLLKSHKKKKALANLTRLKASFL